MEVHKFSKFIHGCAVLLPEEVRIKSVHTQIMKNVMASTKCSVQVNMHMMSEISPVTVLDYGLSNHVPCMTIIYLFVLLEQNCAVLLLLSFLFIIPVITYSSCLLPPSLSPSLPPSHPPSIPLTLPLSLSPSLPLTLPLSLSPSLPPIDRCVRCPIGLMTSV